MTLNEIDKPKKIQLYKEQMIHEYSLIIAENENFLLIQQGYTFDRLVFNKKYFPLVFILAIAVFLYFTITRTGPEEYFSLISLLANNSGVNSRSLAISIYFFSLIFIIFVLVLLFLLKFSKTDYLHKKVSEDIKKYFLNGFPLSFTLVIPEFLVQELSKTDQISMIEFEIHINDSTKTRITSNIQQLNFLLDNNELKGKKIDLSKKMVKIKLPCEFVVSINDNSLQGSFLTPSERNFVLLPETILLFLKKPFLTSNLNLINLQFHNTEIKDEEIQHLISQFASHK